MTQTHNHDKLIERVRKLYAMSQDTSSPHEAAIAAKRARALMDQHGISVESLKTSAFGVAIGDETFTKVPRWYGVLAVGVATYNDCQVRNNGITVAFEGFDVDAQSAALMLDYLVQAMNRQLKVASANTCEAKRRFNNAFRAGFAGDMQRRLNALSSERAQADKQQTDTGTALVVVKNQLVAEHYGMVRHRSARASVSSRSGFAAGKQAAANTRLNTQVGGRTQGRLS